VSLAAHSNDPVAHLYDILAYQEMIREVKLFTDEQNKQGWPTLMLSVSVSLQGRSELIRLGSSDHETGGLSLGKQLDPQI
jgi:alkaline phosphatase